MLQITKTTLVHEATKETENGIYKINYSLCDGSIISLQCTVTTKTNTKTATPEGDKEVPQHFYAGDITLYDSHTLACSLVYNNQIPLLMSDFISITEEIKSQNE